MSLSDGITHIVATPHCNDRYHYDPAYLVQCVRRLQELVGAAPVLSLGCDFHLSYDNLQSVLADPDLYTIGGSRYLLVELSDYSIPTQIGDCFLRLGDRGVTPIITHPERNAILRPNPQRVIGFVELGCAVQITASAITGSWGAKAKEMAQWFLKEKAVQFLATDAHDTVRRPPVLSEARKIVAKQFGDELANSLVDKNPRAVLNDEPLASLKQ